MSFNKLTTFNINGDDIEVLSSDFVKTASMKIPDGFTYDKDYLYLKVKAVSAGEYWGSNKNDDFFPEIELKENYKSFLVAHTFKNHENKKIENAIGDVLSAEWSDRMKCVYLVIRIDKRIAPSIVRGFEKGFMTDVSMGCRVDHVVCSYCGQKAKTRFDYCEHLKTMKGKVMDNGKKVYEINIKPKFHDISAVLNGAERTAKVEGIYVNNSKVAISIADKGLEKVASFDFELNNNEFVTEMLKSSVEELNMEVIATSLKKDKVVTSKDVEKSKKEINKNIEKKSISDMCKKNHEIFNEISDSIKYNFTEYWDRDTCIKYGKILRDIGKNSCATPRQVFSTFLKIIDAAGIELSPLEIHDIFFELFDFDSHDLRGVKSTRTVSDMKLADKLVGRIGISNLGGTIDTVKSVRSLCDEDGFGVLGNMGIPKLKGVIIKSTNIGDQMEDSFISEILRKIISPNLLSRSNHRPHVVARLQKIASGNAPILDNSSHFLPIRISSLEKCASESIKASCDMATVLYSAYQNNRVESFNSEELHENINKIAFALDTNFDEFEKTAAKKLISKGKSLKIALTGIPLTMGYSGLQRARINNGEEVSSLNRFVAENPVNSALLAAAGTKASSAIINKNHKKAKFLTEDVADLIKSNASRVSSKINKTASFDIFNNKNIDVRMNQSGYSKNDLQAIKYATVLNKIGDESSAEALMFDKGICISDIDKYLKVASDFYKIELEKIAGNMLKNVAESIGSDMIFDNVKKGSGLAMLPGYVADGLMIAGVGKGLKKALSKKPKEGNFNG